MISIEFIRSLRDGHPCEPEVVARVIADGADLDVDGLEPEIIDRDQPVINLRTGGTIKCADDPEEWARGLAVAFRTPYLSARILEDTCPLADVVIARADVQEPVYR